MGITYGGPLKQPDKAIAEYKKCTEMVPEYASCYNNVGVNYENKREYETALDWYFKAMEKDPEYKAPHQHAIDMFRTLKWSDEQVLTWMGKYPGVQAFFFYYNQGLAHAAKKHLP